MRTQLAFQRKVPKTFAELSQREVCGICRDKLHGESEIGFIAGCCYFLLYLHAEMDAARQFVSFVLAPCPTSL